MSDDLIKRLDNLWAMLEEEGFYVKANTVVLAKNYIEQLLEERDEAWRRAGHSEQKWGETETKLAKAMEYLRKIAAYTHIGTHEQGIVQNAEARIACTALAELEGK